MKTTQAIILVAGEGKRLLPFTESHPKCLAEVGGTTILENGLAACAAAGVMQARIVVGHHADVVRARLGNRSSGIDLEYVENRDYACTNSMYSLHLGLLGARGPLWVLEGDVFFEAAILDLPTVADISWLVDSSRRDLDGAYLTAESTGRASALEIVHDLTTLRANQAKSIGMLHVEGEGVGRLQAWLAGGVAEGKRNLYYDLIIRDHFGEAFIAVVDVKGKRWFEIDSTDDLDNARRLFGS